MRTFKRLNDKGIMVSSDVFASYYNDEGDEEWIYFKLLPINIVERFALVLKDQKVLINYKIDKNNEVWRNGYINTKVRLHIIKRKDLRLSDIKQMLNEMAFALGYKLHWMTVNNLLNLKIDY